MSFSYGFYNGDDRWYNAVQVSELFDGLIRDGIYATIGTSMIVRKSGQANKVIVGVGRAWFNHTWSYNDSDMLLSGPESDLFLDRWDAIVLDIHSADAYRTNAILWVTGTAASSPKKPTMIKEPGHYQYPLAYVYRKTNTSTINQENITNMVGTSDTPFVTGILDTLNIDNLLLQWKDQWAQFVLNYEQTAVDWTNTQRTAFENYVKEFEAEMDAWMKSMKDALGDNVATNLQNQITNIKTQIGSIMYLDLTKYITSTSGSVKSVIQQIVDGLAADGLFYKTVIGRYAKPNEVFIIIRIYNYNDVYYGEGLVLGFTDLLLCPAYIRIKNSTVDVNYIPIMSSLNSEQQIVFRVLSQTEYNELSSKNSNTIYFITE